MFQHINSPPKTPPNNPQSPQLLLFFASQMISQDSLQATSNGLEVISNPRISFSSEFLDESNFISICPNPQADREREAERIRIARNAEFEFLLGGLTNMTTADEQFSDGKLLFGHADVKLNKISLKPETAGERPQQTERIDKEEGRISSFLDDDPSPRPPKCTVLWKELLRLRKQRARASPSAPSSSSPRRSSSLAKTLSPDHGRKEGVRNKDKDAKQSNDGQERTTTRTARLRVRPVTNYVPICTKNSSLPPLFPLKKKCALLT